MAPATAALELAVVGESQARRASAGLWPGELETQRLLTRLAGVVGPGALANALLAAADLPQRLAPGGRLLHQPGVAHPDLLLDDGRTVLVVEVKENAPTSWSQGVCQFDHYLRRADAAFPQRDRAFVLLDARGRSAAALPDPPAAPERWCTASYRALAAELLPGTRSGRVLRRVPWSSRLPVTPEAVAVRSAARALLAVAGNVAGDQDAYRAAAALGPVWLTRGEEAELVMVAAAALARWKPRAERAAGELTGRLRDAGHHAQVRHDRAAGLPWMVAAQGVTVRFGVSRGGRQLEARVEGPSGGAGLPIPSHPDLAFAPIAVAPSGGLAGGLVRGAWTARPTRRYRWSRLDEAAVEATASVAVAVLDVVHDRRGTSRRSRLVSRA